MEREGMDNAILLEIMQHPCQLSDPLCHSYMRNTTAVYIAWRTPELE